MKEIKAPKSFERVIKSLAMRHDLARIGGYRDGGYVLPFSDILRSSVLISGGVGSNARFEADCLDINPSLKITLIDKSFSKIRILLRLLYHFLQRRDKGFVSLIEAVSVFRVLRKSVLVKQFLDEYFTLDSYFKNIGDSKVLIKLDIEGGEYSQLSSLLKFEKNISALCIEFHDLNKPENLSLLNQFIEMTDLQLVFISINESSMFENIPQILELSFSSSCSKPALHSGYLQASAFPSELECVYFNISRDC